VTGENRTLVDGATTRRSATELRPQLAPGARVERACLAFQASALTATASLADLVEERRIELRLLGCRPSVLPLSLHPLKLVPAVGIEPTHACVSDTCSPGELRRVEPPARVELASPRYKPGASPSMLRRQRKIGAGAGNRTQVSRLPCARSPIELHRLEAGAGVEPASRRYECRASPSMRTGPGASDGIRTRVHCMASSDPSRWTTLAEMERVARVELASLVWKTRAPAAIPYPLGRGGGTCTRLKWLMRPCWNYLQSTPQNEYSLVKDLVGAAGFEPANLLRPRQAAFHLPTPRRLDTPESNRESILPK
jgi:hypothetical protein